MEEAKVDFRGLRVLVLDGAGKQTLAMVRGLKEIGCVVTVLCKTKLDVCYASRLPDRKIFRPDIDAANEAYVPELLRLVSTGDYDVLMPVGELSTNPVTQHEDEFKRYVKLACAPRETYIKAFNKQITFDTAMENGIPCPYTRHSTQDIEEYLEKARFPIIIKPRQGLGSIGFHKFEKREDFWPYMHEKGLNPDDYVVQEFIRFENHVGCLFFIDQKGEICTSYTVDVLRRFPIEAGSAVLLKTIDAHDVLQHAGRLLKILGWRGFADVAFMIEEGTGEPKLLEINGRIPQSVKIAFLCGFNISRQMLEMIFDEDVIQYHENEKYDVYLRHFDSDLAWFLQSPDRFRAKPSWFSWKNTKEVLYSKDDKLPFFASFIKKMIDYRAIMKRKQH